MGQLDLLLQLLGLLFDQFDLVLHRALHMAKRLGQPVDIIAGALDGDGVIQRAVGHLLGCFGQGSQRRRDGVGEPAGEEDQQQHRAGTQHNHQSFQLADRGIGFPGGDLGDKGPLGVEHLHLGVGGQHLVILIGVEQPDPLLAGERLGDEGRLQRPEVRAEAVLDAELRCQPGIGAHPLVGADQDGFAGLAQPLPLRHDLVELVRQQLENHHPAHIVVLHHGGRHVGDHLPGQLVAAKIGEFEDLLRFLATIEAAFDLGEGLAQATALVGAGEQIGGKVRVLGDRIDHITVEVHQKDVAVVGLAHHVGIAAMKALVHPAIHLVGEDKRRDGGFDLHLTVRFAQLIPGAWQIAGLSTAAGLLRCGAQLLEGAGKAIETADTVAGKILLGEVDDLLFEVVEVILELTLLDITDGDQMVGGLGGEILAVAV